MLLFYMNVPAESRAMQNKCRDIKGPHYSSKLMEDPIFLFSLQEKTPLLTNSLVGKRPEFSWQMSHFRGILQLFRTKYLVGKCLY